MRILIKSYHYGNNAPPIIAKYKLLGHEVKVLCLQKFNLKQILKEHDISPLISINDLIIPNFSFITEYIYRIGRKFNIKFIINHNIHEVNKLIKTFNPDIILHHSIDFNTYLCLKTNFKPQVCVPWNYDGYLKVKKTSFNWFRDVFKDADGFIFFTKSLKQFYSDEGGLSDERCRIIPIGHPFVEQLKSFSTSKENIRIKYKIPPYTKILFETRGLRDKDGGVFQLLEAYNDILKENKNIFLILLKGILGKPSIINEVKQIIKNYGIESKVLIIENELQYHQVMELYYVSDVFISLLPNDQIGFSISEAIYMKCLLLLSDLRDYHIEFGNNVEYTNPNDPVSLKLALQKVINLPADTEKKRLEETMLWFENMNKYDHAKQSQYFFDELINRQLN